MRIPGWPQQGRYQLANTDHAVYLSPQTVLASDLQIAIDIVREATDEVVVGYPIEGGQHENVDVENASADALRMLQVLGRMEGYGEVFRFDLFQGSIGILVPEAFNEALMTHQHVQEINYDRVSAQLSRDPVSAYETARGLLARVPRVVRASGQRRLSGWARRTLLAAGLDLLMLIILVWTAIATYPVVPLAIVAAAALLGVRSRLQELVLRVYDLTPRAEGAVVVVPGTRDEWRQRRYNNRQNLKVVAITAAVTVIAAVPGTLLVSNWDDIVAWWRR